MQSLFYQFHQVFMHFHFSKCDSAVAWVHLQLFEIDLSKNKKRINFKKLEKYCIQYMAGYKYGALLVVLINVLLINLTM